MREKERWDPRGEPTWPDWKQAQPGTRVEHVRSGRTGTFVRVGGQPGQKHNTAVVDWDDVGFGINRGRTVDPAHDLKEVK